jgi:hypothetical protein
MSTDTLDPFAFAGYEGDGDARILALFSDWLDASRASDRHVHDDDRTEWEAILDRMHEIEEEIIATSGGPAALAVKAYLRLRLDLCNWTPNTAHCDPTIYLNAMPAMMTIL